MKSGPWRLLFMGTPQFALPSLEAILAAGEEVAAVVTQPDRPRGRGQVVTPPPVKELALAWHLPVLQPHSLQDPQLIQGLKALKPELIIVVAYGRILPPEILALPSIGSLNIHASLLPRYRGAAPINWALIRGDETTGVTVQWLRPELDSGPIFFQEQVPINEEDNFGTLYDRLAEVGANLLVKSLDSLRREEAIKLPQSQTEVTLAPPISRKMCRLHWELAASEVAGWIRALDPKPGAYTHWRGRDLKIFGARLKKTGGSVAAPGTVLRLTPQGLEIACGQGSITVKEVQLAGHKRLLAAEFLRGQPLIGQRLE